MRSEKELRRLALDISQGWVWGTWALPENDFKLVKSIFAALHFIEKPLPKDTAHLYEYINKAGSHSINGYPMFATFCLLAKEEWDIVRPMVNELVEQSKSFLEGG